MSVTVYTTHTCPYCQLEKEYLRKRGVDFREVTVDTDRAGLEEMVRLSGQLGVPFTVVEKDEEKMGILGFDQEMLEEVLG